MYNQKTKSFNFKYDKAVQALLYVTKRVHNLYHIVKVLYFADKIHLSKYGRLIFGEKYIAMKSGPVPQNIYDMLKFVRGDGKFAFDERLKELVSYESDKNIFANKDADLNYLSETDIECLNKSISEFGHKHPWFLYVKSHDSAYRSTERDKEIELQKVIGTLKNQDHVKKYLETIYE